MTTAILDVRPAVAPEFAAREIAASDLTRLFSRDRAPAVTRRLICRWHRDADGRLAATWHHDRRVFAAGDPGRSVSTQRSNKSSGV